MKLLFKAIICGIVTAGIGVGLLLKGYGLKGIDTFLDGISVFLMFPSIGVLHLASMILRGNKPDLLPQIVILFTQPIFWITFFYFLFKLISRRKNN